MPEQLPKLISNELIEQLIEWLPKIGLGLMIFIGFWIIANILKFIISKLARTSDTQRNQIIKLLASFTKISLILIGAITALGSIGTNVSALVASLGLSGLGLSFAMKDALSNLLAGIMLFLYKPFKIGDDVIISGLEGKVSKLTLRYVHLNTPQREILIPNSTLLTHNISILKNQNA